MSRDKLQVGHPCPVCGPFNSVCAIDSAFGTFWCQMGTAFSKHTWEDAIVALTAKAAAREVTAKIDTRFPHRCPRCRQTAYVGLNQIEHRDASRDGTCR